MKNWGFLGLMLAATACTVEKRVCPTYQSAFLFDKNTRENHFSHYNNSFKDAMTLSASSGKSIEIPPKDSLWILRSMGLDGPGLPFQKKVARGRYLLLPKKSHRKILNSLQTVERKFVYEAYDSAKMKEIHRLDSISLLDSVYRISVAREKFNVDQDAYLWYFKDQLLLPDARWEKFDKKAEAGRSEAQERKDARKEKWGKLFGWLKRKKTEGADSLTADSTAAEGNGKRKKASKKSTDEEDYNADEFYDVDAELGGDSTAVKSHVKKKKKKKSSKKIKVKKSSPSKSKPAEEKPAEEEKKKKKKKKKKKSKKKKKAKKPPQRKRKPGEKNPAEEEKPAEEKEEEQ